VSASFAVALAGGASLILGSPTGAAAQQQAQSAGQSNAALVKRVEQLEEQLVDMRVALGTLESMSKSGGGGATAPAFGGGLSGNDAARIDGLETQVRALTAQLEQLSRQLQGAGGGQGALGLARGGYAGPNGGGYAAPAAGRGLAAPAAVTASASNSGGDSFGSTEIPGFGSTTVTSDAGGEDPIGGLLEDTGQIGSGQGAPAQGGGYGQGAASQAGGGFGQGGYGATQVAAAPMGGGDPKQLYETAYGYLLQQDYGAAETAFNDFLKKYPSDQLSGNAQYWLGETYFVRAQYKPAAAAFLKGYETYRQSPKAPDSLLKLAMSLDRLGQRQAACSSLSELNAQFPNAPQHVRDKAASERSRVGC